MGAMDSKYDVVIIGAGPGGLVAASELAAGGAKVGVFERADEIGPKVCAGALPLQIHDFDIPEEIVSCRFSSITAHANGRSYELTQPSPFLYTADRGRLGRFLADRARDNGAEIFTGARVSKISPNKVTVNGEEVSYRFLVGADGSHSIARKYLGLPIRKVGSTLQCVVPRDHERFELFFDARTFGSGIGWIVPHDGYTLIGLGRELDEARGKNLKGTLYRWALKQGVDITGVRMEAWPINYDYRGWRFGNLFLVGDAAGFASGLTGEGIYAAMVSGRVAARSILGMSVRSERLEQLLKKKRSHERLLYIMQSGLSVLPAYHRILMSLARRSPFTRQFVEYLF